MVPSGWTISNDQVSWLAPPESLTAPATPVAPGYHEATQRPSCCLHHLPLNFAGRFSRKAVTPSLKSSAAPAIRCDSNSRLSWSSNELSGLSQYSLADQRQRHGRAVGELMRELHGLFHQRRVVIDPVDEAPFQRLLGRQPLAHQRQFDRARLADQPRQQPGRSAVRHQADAAEGLQEIGRARAQDHVAHQREAHAGAGGRRH